MCALFGLISLDISVVYFAKFDILLMNWWEHADRNHSQNFAEDNRYYGKKNLVLQNKALFSRFCSLENFQNRGVFILQTS